MTASASRVRAVVLEAPGRLALRSLPRPPVGPDEALVAVELNGICGTDAKYLAGTSPVAYPVILGHEIVGRVAAIGERAAERYGVGPGDRVLLEGSIPCWACAACRAGQYRLCPTKGGYGGRRSVDVGHGLWGGLAELVGIAPGSILHRLPDDLAPEIGVGIPLAANGLQWLVRKGGMGPGDRVLVLGCGPQGLAAAMIARAAGAREVVVTGLATDAPRLALAAELGARPVVVGGSDEAGEDPGGDYDVVLEVSGSPASIAAGPARVRRQGTFVLAGLAGSAARVPLATDDLVWREIRVQGVLTKDEAAITAALGLVLADPSLRSGLARLVTHVFPLERAADAIGAATAGLPGFVKAAVAPRRAG